MSETLTTQMAEALPVDVAISETIQFLRGFPVGDHPRVLEVGCGSGELALRLGLAGWQVLGIDIDAEVIANSQRRGVNAIQADLLTFESQAFDVVLVTHSLHHISPLEAAVDQLLRLMQPGGWLLVEEFDYSAMDEATATWFYERKDLLEEAGVLRAERPRLHSDQPLERFRAHHRHHAHREHHFAPKHGHDPSGFAHLHTGRKMREAIETRFKILLAESAPYLYRYLTAELEPTSRGQRVTRLFLEQEHRALDKKEIRPLGLRFVARKP